MIPLAVPNIGLLEREYVAAALADGYVGPDGPFVRQFESLVAKAAGRTWAVATITGTAALHAAVATLWAGSANYERVRIGRDAFPAMSNILTMLGRAHSYDLSGTNHDLAVYRRAPIELAIADRAPAIGEDPCLDAAVECYSFAANKTVTCGHGGAIVGDDPALEEAIRTQIVQGYGRPGHMNYRMANLNAALGCAQMLRLEELRMLKRRVWNRYIVRDLPLVHRGASRWMCTLNVPCPADFVKELAASYNIQARAEPSGVSIPCSTGLSKADQDKVIAACQALLSS